MGRSRAQRVASRRWRQIGAALPAYDPGRSPGRGLVILCGQCTQRCTSALLLTGYLLVVAVDALKQCCTTLWPSLLG
ncbi:hypothetical protein HC891_14765 [Candidatus Gracilibacteria bacterium]|nr:hypothetical protein [Candidatus Gracilibacteria bacterium]